MCEKQEKNYFNKTKVAFQNLTNNVTISEIDWSSSKKSSRKKSMEPLKKGRKVSFQDEAKLFLDTSSLPALEPSKNCKTNVEQQTLNTNSQDMLRGDTRMNIQPKAREELTTTQAYSIGEQGDEQLKIRLDLVPRLSLVMVIPEETPMKNKDTCSKDTVKENSEIEHIIHYTDNSTNTIEKIMEMKNQSCDPMVPCVTKSPNNIEDSAHASNECNIFELTTNVNISRDEHTGVQKKMSKKWTKLFKSEKPNTNQSKISSTNSTSSLPLIGLPENAKTNTEDQKRNLDFASAFSERLNSQEILAPPEEIPVNITEKSDESTNTIHDTSIGDHCDEDPKLGSCILACFQFKKNKSKKRKLKNNSANDENETMDGFETVPLESSVTSSKNSDDEENIESTEPHLPRQKSSLNCCKESKSTENEKPRSKKTVFHFLCFWRNSKGPKSEAVDPNGDTTVDSALNDKQLTKEPDIDDTIIHEVIVNPITEIEIKSADDSPVILTETFHATEEETILPTTIPIPTEVEPIGDIIPVNQSETNEAEMKMEMDKEKLFHCGFGDISFDQIVKDKSEEGESEENNSISSINSVDADNVTTIKQTLVGGCDVPLNDDSEVNEEIEDSPEVPKTHEKQ